MMLRFMSPEPTRRLARKASPDAPCLPVHPRHHSYQKLPPEDSGSPLQPPRKASEESAAGEESLRSVLALTSEARRSGAPPWLQRMHRKKRRCASILLFSFRSRGCARMWGSSVKSPLRLQASSRFARYVLWAARCCVEHCPAMRLAMLAVVRDSGRAHRALEIPLRADVLSDRSSFQKFPSWRGVSEGFRGCSSAHIFRPIETATERRSKFVARTAMM